MTGRRTAFIAHLSRGAGHLPGFSIHPVFPGLAIASALFHQFVYLLIYLGDEGEGHILGAVE